jgi:hypothetical protein
VCHPTLPLACTCLHTFFGAMHQLLCACCWRKD